MAFHPNAQVNLISGTRLDPIGSLVASVQKAAPWESIVDFATHDSYCGHKLYPRQLTLLKLIYLETDQMSAFDIDVVEEWRAGFTRHRDVFGVQPDIWERIKYLKARGARRFPHIQAVLGRRASKGFIGGILGCEQLAYFYSLDDWQAHFGVAPGKDGYINVGATSQTQAKDHQFADIRMLVEDCKYLQPHIAETKDYMLSIRTPADLRQIAEKRAAKIPIEHAIASLQVQALSASASAFRGATALGLFLDEFAFMIHGTGSVKSGEEIYEDAHPSLDQFDLDSLTYIPSSPACLAPDTSVLTEDLRWVPVGSLQVGDHLMGFDEYPTIAGRGQGRKWQQAVVTETSVFESERYELVTESGKRIICTGDHRWLSRRSQFDYTWVYTTDLRSGDKIKSLGVDPWQTDESRDGGYLAGFFDGEGHFSTKNQSCDVGFSQRPGATQDRVERLLQERKFDVKVYLDPAHPDPARRQPNDIAKSRIGGGFPEIMRFLGSIRPERLMTKFADRFYGSRIYGRSGPAVDRVVSVCRVDDGPVVALGTSTETLVAEGLLTHNTRIGKCFSLYQEGSVLMSSYRDQEGISEEATNELQVMAAKRGEDAAEVQADPTKLIIQLGSWGLYQDWERSKQLVGVVFKRPVQWGPDHETQLRRKMRNPEKFDVERAGQWADVQGAYFDAGKIEQIFRNPGWRPNLEPQSRGYLTNSYRIHCDPGRVSDNFAMCIGHLETAPCDRCGFFGVPNPYSGHVCKDGGKMRPHVIIDLLHVWKPSDFPPDVETGRPTIDYAVVQEDIDRILYNFPSTTKISFDQWNSALGIAQLRRKYSPGIRVTEEFFTEKTNQARFEKVKAALNLGFVHSYRDRFYEDGGSLLELEMRYLGVSNGRVDHQKVGPVTTKDLYDAFSVVVSDLLHQELERYQAGGLALAVGSTNVAGLRSGREVERMTAFTGKGSDLNSPNQARQKLAQQKLSRARSRLYTPGRESSIRQRDKS